MLDFSICTDKIDFRCVLTVTYYFQGLIAGILALAAAFFAALPGWRQLKLSRVQSVAARISELDRRILEVENSHNTIDSSYGRLMLSLSRSIFNHEGDVDSSEVTEPVAHELLNETCAFIDTIDQEIEAKKLPYESEVRAIELRDASHKLERAFYYIQAPATVDIFDLQEPSEDLTNEEFKANLEAEAEKSITALTGIIEEMRKTHGKLNSTIRFQMSSYRSERRNIFESRTL